YPRGRPIPHGSLANAKVYPVAYAVPPSPFPNRYSKADRGEIRCQGNPVSVHHSCPGGKSGVGGEIRCQFIILARKDELTLDYEKMNRHRITRHRITPVRTSRTFHVNSASVITNN